MHRFILFYVFRIPVDNQPNGDIVLRYLQHSSNKLAVVFLFSQLSKTSLVKFRWRNVLYKWEKSISFSNNSQKEHNAKAVTCFV